MLWRDIRDPGGVERWDSAGVEVVEEEPYEFSSISDAAGLPDRLPAIGDLQWASGGHLWVGRRTAEDGEPPEYDVIDPEGRWLGTVTLPEGLGSIHEIGEGHEEG